MGREETRLRRKKIQLWVTDAEYEFIQDKAKYCNLSMSEYIRKMSKDGAIIKRDFSGVKEVKKIGVNINQIARKVNENSNVSESDFEQLRLEFEKLFEVVYAQIIGE